MLKKILGAVILILGLFALVTPFTPGSWLIFVGLELLGLGLVFNPNNGCGKWAARLGLKPRQTEDQSVDMEKR